MHKVGIVGLGNIAAGYSGPEDAAPCTHVGGTITAARWNLPLSLISRRMRWKSSAPSGVSASPNTEYYDSFQEMLAGGGLDIVTICSSVDLTEHGMPAAASPFKPAYEQIADHLSGGPLSDCADDHFVAVHEIGFAGIESILTHRRIEIPNKNRTRRIFANG